MSGFAAAYYAECTRKGLASRYTETATGLWQCKCGAAPFDTEGSLTHRCSAQTASAIVPAVEIPMVRIDTLIGTVVRLGDTEK